MRYSDRIQWFQCMHESNALSIFLYYSEELPSIRRVGLFINSRVYFLLDDLTEFFQLSSWNGYSLFYPWLVLNYWNFHRWEEVMSKTPPFLIIPGESPLLFYHEVV